MIRRIIITVCLLSLFACVNIQPNEAVLPTKSFDNKFVASDSRITRMGRAQVLSKGELRFSYPGVSLNFHYQGRSLSMLVSGSQGNSYIEVFVDDHYQKIRLPREPSVISLFTSDVVAEHKVELIHSSETWHGIVTIDAFYIDQGHLLGKPESPKNKIIVIGDSVTCGEAIDRPVSSAECGNKNTSWWNARLSYGMLMAKALNAQVQLVCMGGRGLIRSWNGVTSEPQAPKFYDLTIPDGVNSDSWFQQNYSADLVLISLGTNDFSASAGTMPTEAQYVPVYVDLVEKILNDHPQAKIVLTEGALLAGEQKRALIQYLRFVKEKVGSDRVFVVGSNEYHGDTCDFHPTKAQHQQMAHDFIFGIKEILLW